MLCVEHDRIIPLSTQNVNRSHFTEKCPQGIQITLGIHRIAKSMSRAGDGDQLLAAGAGIVIAFAHEAGYIFIALAMVENNGDLAIFNCFFRGCFL